MLQIYFGPSGTGEREELITPYMRDTARGFIDGIKAQCGEAVRP